MLNLINIILLLFVIFGSTIALLGVFMDPIDEIIEEKFAKE